MAVGGTPKPRESRLEVAPGTPAQISSASPAAFQSLNGSPVYRWGIQNSTRSRVYDSYAQHHSRHPSAQPRNRRSGMAIKVISGGQTGADRAALDAASPQALRAADGARKARKEARRLGGGEACHLCPRAPRNVAER